MRTNNVDAGAAAEAMENSEADPERDRGLPGGILRSSHDHGAARWPAPRGTGVVLEEDGRAFVIAVADAVRVRNIGHNPQVALSIATDQRPWKYVVVEGEGRVTNQELSTLLERICVVYDGPERGPAFAEELLSEGRPGWWTFG